VVEREVEEEEREHQVIVERWRKIFEKRGKKCKELQEEWEKYMKGGEVGKARELEIEIRKTCAFPSGKPEVVEREEERGKQRKVFGRPLLPAIGRFVAITR